MIQGRARKAKTEFLEPMSTRRNKSREITIIVKVKSGGGRETRIIERSLKNIDH